MAIGSHATINRGSGSSGLVGGKMKLVKITNPNWLTVIAPRINEYAKLLKQVDIQYENLYAYLAQSIQSAQLQQLEYDVSEFWVIMYENKPKAFAHWLRRPLPHIGKVYMDGIYNWSKSSKVVGMLIDQFIEFGKQHRATIYQADVLNEKLFRLFDKYANERGIDWQNSGLIHCIGKKKEIKK